MSIAPHPNIQVKLIFMLILCFLTEIIKFLCYILFLFLYFEKFKVYMNLIIFKNSLNRLTVQTEPAKILT